MKIHDKCGGEVRKRKCLKCGKTWSRARYWMTSEVSEKEVKFDEAEYKKRIRERRDLPK